MEIKVIPASIKNRSISLNKTTLNLSVSLDFEAFDRSAYVSTSFSCNRAQDMINLLKLMHFTNCESANHDTYESAWLQELEGKEVRIVLHGSRLVAIGHPTEDVFFKTRGLDPEFTLEEIKRNIW